MIYVIFNRINFGWKEKIFLEFFNVGKVVLGLRFSMLIVVIIFEILFNKVNIFYNVKKKIL